MKRFFIVAMVCVALVAGATSCKKNADLPLATEKGEIRIEKFEGVERGKGLAGDLLLSVSNGMRSNVTLSSGSVTVCYGDKPICTLALTGEVVLPKRVVSSVRVPVAISVTSPVLSYGLLAKFLRGEFDKMSLTLDAEMKVGVIRKKFHREELPLSEAMQLLGVSPDTIKKIVKR